MTKNMPASALDNPFAKQQKVLLYLLPIFFAVSGVNFPIGVLIYWFTTNVWSMCQQFYVIRRMPAPGSAAEKALQERRRKQGKPIRGVHRQGSRRPRRRRGAEAPQKTSGQRAASLEEGQEAQGPGAQPRAARPQPKPSNPSS